MSESTQPASVGNVFYPVGDVAAAAAFYGETLGLGTKFVDGSRYAALDGGTVTFALAGEEEDVTGGRPAASLRVESVDDAVAAAVSAGATLRAPAEVGPHEIRAVVDDPWGNAVIIYSKVV